MLQLHSRSLVLFAFFWAMGTLLHAQRVGVVLSGGGASAMSHIGFLRALEENDIPIDYIAGTSMGAIVGAMYASGMTVEQIDSLVRTREFDAMANGIIPDEYSYYFKNADPDPSIATIKYSRESFISSTLPTNIVDPQLMNFRFLEEFSPVTAAARSNFDSLYIPFRCIAADIESKEEIVFRSGNLAQVIRASATYPFYIPPIRIDGRLLFDGGLYNNFPSNVIYEDFLPDVIIGSNVSENTEPPMENDLISQVKNMVLFKTNFEPLCENMYIVESAADIGTFEFDKVGEAIASGYAATNEKIDSILTSIHRRVSMEERNEKRKIFRDKLPEMVFDEITILGLEKAQQRYVRNLLGKDADSIHVNDIRTEYFRLLNDDKIKTIYPLAVYKPSTGRFNLLLDVEKEKDIMITFGGNFSSRPINTGYIGLKYNIFSKFSSTLSANSYFGKFYGSIRAAAKFDFAARQPFSLEPHYVRNRWDYFRSSTTFFEDVKPSFIVKKESYAGVKLRFPAGARGRVDSKLRYVHFSDDYYQTETFLSSDTADQTVFDGGAFRLQYERSTLNRKQYATKGTYLKLSGQYVRGQERSIPGSTTANKDTLKENHEWIGLKVQYQNYFERLGRLSLGFRVEGTFTDQPFFQNYIASIMRAPSFEPIPESKTLFLNQFRAHAYAAGGLQAVYSLRKNLDIRAEAYAFQAYQDILSDDENKAFYRDDPETRYIGSASLVFHSPLGPLSLNLNYFDQKDEPWSFLLNFGYILFNDSAID